MQRQDKVIAIVCSDIHLSPRPPRARIEEPDWFEAMKRTLQELSAVAAQYDAPILCAGDIFDHWRAPPELISFAIKHLPQMYAIPGQHDLPLHNLDLLERSAFWTMVLAGKIEYLEPGKTRTIAPKVTVTGYSWGNPIQPLEDPVKSNFNIAIAHDYFWTDNYCFEGAPDEHEAQEYKGRFAGFDAVAFGDNHKGFTTNVGGVPVMNCGGFMRRKIDEVDYRPQVGLICRSGRIMSHKLRISGERFTSKEQDDVGLRSKLMSDMSDMITGLEELMSNSFDFTEAIQMAMDRKMVSKQLRRTILEILER